MVTELEVPTGAYVMNILLSCLGVVIISGLLYHLYQNLYNKSEINMPWPLKIGTTAVFVCYLSVCLSTLLFKMDIIFPWKSRACIFGDIWSYILYGLSRICLFATFMLRIDTSLKGSIFAYNRLFLLGLNLFYISIQIALIVVVAVNISVTGITMQQTKLGIDFCIPYQASQTLYLASLAYILPDSALHMFLCYLFITKLKQVRDVTNDSDIDNRRLTYVMRKQTILVSIKTFVTLVVWLPMTGVSWFFLIIPLDCIVSVICLWLMFKFTEHVWDFLTNIFDPSRLNCCFSQIFTKSSSPINTTTIGRPDMLQHDNDSPIMATHSNNTSQAIVKVNTDTEPI